MAKGGIQKLASQLLFQKMAQSGVLSYVAYARLDNLVTYGGWASFGFIGIMLYGLAVLCWMYHRCATAVCRECGLRVTGVPLLYFVVTTAVFGFWLGIATRAIAWISATPKVDLFDYKEALATTINAHPYLTVCLMLTLTGAHLVSLQTWRQGMKEAYGNSGLALFAVDVTFFVLLLLALEVVIHTMPGR